MRFIGYSHVPTLVMSRDVPDVVVFALVVVVTVSVVALPASALGGATATATTADGGVAPQTTNGSANGSETLAPGQRLAGVVGVQGAEIDGELEERTLATRVDRAESNTSKAAVVATELNTARERLRNLRETQTALREARRSGDISTGEYRARMAITAAQIRTVRTQLDSSEAVSRDLPDAALEARGVNRGEIDRLREDADELSGPKVAEIARQVAGDDENDRENGERGGPPEDAGNGGAGNRSETAGPPDEAENDEEDDDSGDGPGNSNGAGNSGDAGNGNGSEDSPGNSGDAGNDDDSEDSPGNSGDAGNGNGSEDSPGNSGDAGNDDDSDDGGNDDDSEDSPGNSDGAGNGDGSDGAGNGDGSDGAGNGGDGPGNSGDRGGGNR